MSGISAIIRSRIEAQGFIGFSDEDLSPINYWLRFSPAICMTWTALGVVPATPLVLWALVPFAVLGGVFKSHPFDVFYNHGPRHIFDNLGFCIPSFIYGLVFGDVVCEIEELKKA
jgi:hypothetical protein